MVSRRKCIFLRAGKIPPRQPLHDGGEGDVEKSDLEKEQERKSEILAVDEGVADEVTEIDGESDFDNREERLQWHVAAGTPRLRSALDAVLRCALEFRFVIENGFEHSARVIDRQTDAECKKRRQQKHFLHPGARMQFTLRANVKDRDRERRGEK